MNRLKLAGLTAFSALLLTCFVSYNTNYYLYPDRFIINKVIPDVLILFPKNYDEVKVAFTMRVESIQHTGSSVVITSSSRYGSLNVWCEDASLAEGLHPRLSIIVIGICRIASKGYVEARYIHPNFNAPLISIANVTGLLFLLYYTSPHWIKKIKRS